MLRRTHDHHRGRSECHGVSLVHHRTVHATTPEKFAVTRHGLSPVPARQHPRCGLSRLKRASSLVSNAAELPRVGHHPHRQRHQIPATISDTSHHVPHRPMPIVTSPRSTENRNTHRPSSAARGFVPRRLSYAKRRPKLFTRAERRLPGGAEAKLTDRYPMAPTGSATGYSSNPPRLPAVRAPKPFRWATHQESCRA